MEFKVVVSDPKTGKSFQLDLKDENARKIRHNKIGDAIDGAILGLPGYTLEITGGSDKGGFPMKKGLHGQKAAYVLAESGIGYRPDGSVRRRRRMRGEAVSENIIQVNTMVKEYGRKPIEEILGVKSEAKESSGGAGEGGEK